MRVKILLFMFCVTVLFGAYPKNKADYNISIGPLAKSNGNLNYQLYDNQKFEISLAKGGYFTIGTKEGNSVMAVDDNCSVTFGHPFAKTSYPIIAIDGEWHKPEEYFTDLYATRVDDHLRIIKRATDKFSFEFQLFITDDDDIILETKIVNLDNETRSIGSGIVLDPGIGKWNDGALQSGAEFIEDKALLTEVPELYLWEKAVGAKGLGVKIEPVPDSFDRVIVDNWHFSCDQNSPELSESTISELYDMLLKCYFQEQMIAAGDSLVNTLRISFPEPDFSSEVFMRWDLPNFLDMNNGAMFPRSLSTFVNLSKTTEIAAESGNIMLEFPNQLSSGESTYSTNFSGDINLFKRVPVYSEIAYEDLVVEVKSHFVADDKIIDEYSRKIFIPETPTSDSGLTVYDDSLITAEYPQVSLVFNLEVNETGRKVLGLKEENIFLYENETRINDFNLGFFESDDVNDADIVFVLDVTGSMSNEINAVKNNIVAFADKLEERGIDYQLAMITFLDDIEEVYEFTDNVMHFKDLVGGQYAHGGGNYPENSIDALMRATELQYRERSKRTIIWITDASFYDTDYTKQDVVEECLAQNITVHCIGNPAEQTEFYNPIVNPTGGNYYDINGDFQTILLDVADMGGEYKYQLTYNSIFPDNSQNDIYLKIRYNGLGTQSVFNYDVPGETVLNMERMSFYPNPFNERINFVLNVDNLNNTKMTIYNILGKKVREFTITANQGYRKIFWNGKDMLGRDVGTGLYIIQLSAITGDGKKLMKTDKILYLK